MVVAHRFFLIKNSLKSHGMELLKQKLRMITSPEEGEGLEEEGGGHDVCII